MISISLRTVTGFGEERKFSFLSFETLMKPEGIREIFQARILSIETNHRETRRDQRDFPGLPSASLIICFRNPSLGKCPAITLEMQEGHARPNLTFRMGKVSPAQDA